MNNLVDKVLHYINESLSNDELKSKSIYAMNTIEYVLTAEGLVNKFSKLLELESFGSGILSLESKADLIISKTEYLDVCDKVSNRLINELNKLGYSVVNNYNRMLWSSSSLKGLVLVSDKIRIAIKVYYTKSQSIVSVKITESMR